MGYHRNKGCCEREAVSVEVWKEDWAQENKAASSVCSNTRCKEELRYGNSPTISSVQQKTVSWFGIPESKISPQCLLSAIALGGQSWEGVRTSLSAPHLISVSDCFYLGEQIGSDLAVQTDGCVSLLPGVKWPCLCCVAGPVCSCFHCKRSQKTGFRVCLCILLCN